MARYASPSAGLPPQMTLHTGRAVFTEAYAVIPRDCMRDIVTSYLPHWRDTIVWIIARPLSGFSETFSQYVVEAGEGLARAKALAAKAAENAPLTNFALIQVLPRIADADPAAGYVTEALMAAVAQGDAEAKRRLADFLEKRAAKVPPPG